MTFINNNDFGEKTLALVTYSSITRDGDTVLVNRAFGMLIDDLAKSFKKINYVAAEAEKESSVYNKGKSIYRYSIRAWNVVIASTQPTGGVGNPLSRVRRMITNQLRVNEIIHESEFVYIFMPGYTGLFAAFACIFTGKTYFLYFGSDWNETARFRLPTAGDGNVLNRLALKTYTFFENFVVKRAIFCLAAGKRLAELYVANNPRTFETVPMVQFLLTEFQHKKATEIHQEEIPGGSAYSSGKKKVTLLSVGNVQESKGSIYLLKALPMLLKKGFDINVQLVGAVEEVYRDKLLAELNDLGIKDDVDFVGYVNDVDQLQAFYRIADVFILPTLGEGFPRVLYEAMMSGVPVVASDIDSIRENTHGTEALTLVPPEDPEAIAAAVEELLKNDTLRENRIEAGYRFAERKFYASPAAQLLQLLKEFGH